MIPNPVHAWIAEQGYGIIQSIQPVGGGCINHGARLLTSTGMSYFLKTNPDAPADMFRRESEGLSALRSCIESDQVSRLRVPQPKLYGDNFLLLEDLNPAPPRENYWVEFGRKLANLHLKYLNPIWFRP